MRWNKTSRTIAIVSTLGLALTGCSSSSESGAGADGVTTLTFAAATFTETGRGPGLTEWIDKFNASQTGVKVVPLAVPVPTFGTTILTQLGAGQGPDLIRFDMPEYAQAVEANLIEPLDDLIDASSYELYETPDQYSVIDEVRYAVMFEISNYAMLYNADLVASPPTTYAEFASVAKASTRDGVYGTAFRHTLPENNGMMQDLFNWVYGFGGSWSDGEKLTLNSAKVVEGLTAYQDTYDAGVIPSGATASTYRTMFGANKVGMLLDNGGVVGIVKGMNPDLNVAVAPIPFPVQQQGSILAPLVVNKSSKNKEAASVFLKWMLEPENQAQLQTVLGASSVATKVDRTAEELATAPYLKIFDGLTDSGHPHIIDGFESKTPDIRKIITEQVLAALQGQQDMKTAMDNAQKLATAAVGG